MSLNNFIRISLFAALASFGACGDGSNTAGGGGEEEEVITCFTQILPLKSGSYETKAGQAITFPGAGVTKKSMVYDQQTGKLTVTYTYNGKTYVETWAARLSTQ